MGRISKGKYKLSPQQCEAARIRATKHGGYSDQSTGWRSWDGMVQRVTNPRCNAYPDYGGRGLDMDPRWSKFANFLTDMGPRPAGTSLGRIDNERGYWPDNCRWETGEQQSNNKRTSVFVEYRGERMTMAQVARLIGVSRYRVRYHLSAGRNINDLSA